MRIIAVSLLISVAMSATITPIQQQQQLEVTKDDVKNFIVGFLLSIRFAEEVPEAFSCITSAANLKTAVHDAIVLIKSGKFDNVVHGIQAITAGFNDASKQCGDAAIETKNYVIEIDTIINDPNFVHDAKAALYKYAEVVGRDVAELLAAKEANDWFTAGIYAGDIGRIVLWHEPNPKAM